MNIPPYNNRPDMGRLREIIRVMTKYQFGNILEAVGLKNRLFETLKLYIKSPEEVHEPHMYVSGWFLRNLEQPS